MHPDPHCPLDHQPPPVANDSSPEWADTEPMPARDWTAPSRCRRAPAAAAPARRGARPLPQPKPWPVPPREADWRLVRSGLLVISGALSLWALGALASAIAQWLR